MIFKTPYGNVNADLKDNELSVVLVVPHKFYQNQIDQIVSLVNLCLRNNIAMSEIVGQLSGIRGPDVVFDSGKIIYSISDAIAKMLDVLSAESSATGDVKVEKYYSAVLIN